MDEALAADDSGRVLELKRGLAAEDQALLLHEVIRKAKPTASALALIKDGASVNAVDKLGNTPLHYAVYCMPSIVEALLAAGARTDVKNKYLGETVFFSVAEHSVKPEIISLLIKHGANINAKNTKRETPLHRAANLNMVETAALLLANKADVKAVNSRLQTPLHYATVANSESMARLLLRGGADLMARDCSNSTSVCVARGQNLFHVLLALEAALDDTKYWNYQESLLVSAPVIIATLLSAHRAMAEERLSRLPTEVWFVVFSFLKGPQCYPHVETLEPAHNGN